MTQCENHSLCLTFVQFYYIGNEIWRNRMRLFVFNTKNILKSIAWTKKLFTKLNVYVGGSWRPLEICTYDKKDDISKGEFHKINV